MKYKILHLPTATYLYHYDCNQGDLFTEYEYNLFYKKNRSQKSSNIFDTLSIVEKYISIWTENGLFSWSEIEKTRLRREHLEIIKVRDV